MWFFSDIFEFLNKKCYSYKNNHATKNLCDCGASNPPKLSYWSEKILQNWPILALAMGILMVAAFLLCIITEYGLIPYYSYKNQKKYSSCEDLATISDGKFDSDDFKSNQNRTLSTVDTKF